MKNVVIQAEIEKSLFQVDKLRPPEFPTVMSRVASRPPKRDQDEATMRIRRLNPHHLNKIQHPIYSSKF